MKIYIAREPSDSDNWAEHKFYGIVKLFYDTPEFEYNPITCKIEWCRARKIGEAPYYMYSKLSPDKYIELVSI